VKVDLNEYRGPSVGKHEIESGNLDTGERAEVGYSDHPRLLPLGKQAPVHPATPAEVVVESPAHPEIAHHLEPDHNYAEIHTPVLHPLLDEERFFLREPPKG
jgi:hypothetical protein